MPFIETVSELVDHIADLAYVYGTGPEFGDHPGECECRMCYVIGMGDRIREAVKNDSDLAERMGVKP